jgi:ATP-binding cassette subfamily F protein uup
MASILTACDLSKTYATHMLFTDVSLTLGEGDRLGLIGPNGSGKSTLLKIIAEVEIADSGKITRRKLLTTAYVPQDDHFPDSTTVLSAVMDPLAHDPTGRLLDEETRATITLGKLGFSNLHQSVGSLSGGWRKRLSMACALADEPDVLMLDEPTNHLDLEGVLWLEQFVRQANMAVVVITHDRTFLESVANRIIELSPAYPHGTFEVKGNYTQFVRRKNEFLDSQLAQQTALASKVRRDTAWLLQGIQGRQTRNKSQVAAANERRDDLQTLRKRNTAPARTTEIKFQATDRKTNKLLVAHNIAISMGGKRLFKNLDLMLSPGMRLGLLGPNGSGKTTLLRLLNGELEPEAGTIKPAADLRIVYFTQHRHSLNPKHSLREALCPSGDTVFYCGKPLHVASWAKKFLFDPKNFNTSVGDLSGGEQARIMIANLMLQPADVLFLDEPTNDLDIPSLEVLEQALIEFPGAIVLVTHDRFMIDRLSTELIALDGCEGAKRYVTYYQWQQAQIAEKAAAEKPLADKPTDCPESSTTRRAKKLTLKERLELEKMEHTILEAEADADTLEAQAADPAIIAAPLKHAEVCHKLGDLHTRIRQLYDRWVELEAMQQG